MCSRKTKKNDRVVHVNSIFLTIMYGVRFSALSENKVRVSVTDLKVSKIEVFQI